MTDTKITNLTSASASTGDELVVSTTAATDRKVTAESVALLALRGSVAVSTSVISPTTSEGVTLGTSSLRWAGVFTSSGVNFPSAQDASADANTLDDYEEGTFTPTWTPATTGTYTVGYNAATTGNYTKIGNAIRVSGIMSVTTFTSGSGSGNMGISNLPFVSRGDGAGFLDISSATSGYRGIQTCNMGTAATICRGQLRVSTTGATSQLQLSDCTTGANSFIFNGIYGGA